MKLTTPSISGTKRTKVILKQIQSLTCQSLNTVNLKTKVTLIQDDYLKEFAIFTKSVDTPQHIYV